MDEGREEVSAKLDNSPDPRLVLQNRLLKKGYSPTEGHLDSMVEDYHTLNGEGHSEETINLILKYYVMKPRKRLPRLLEKLVTYLAGE